jgi:hypothetical protein
MGKNNRNRPSQSVGQILGNPNLSNETVPEELVGLQGNDGMTFKQLLMLEAFRVAITPTLQHQAIGSIIRQKQLIQSALADAISLARFTGETYDLIVADEEAVADL